MSSYCDFARGYPFHGPYHDQKYGFPIADDDRLFERLVLEINPAIENARRIIKLRKSHGSFAAWLDAHHPRSKEGWVKLFRQTFVFTGGEITGSFLLSIGYLPGAHDESCPVFARIARLGPPWMRVRK